MQSTSTTHTTFRPDEHLAQHLLGLGFTETSSAYHWARGWRSFYHPRVMALGLASPLTYHSLFTNWLYENQRGVSQGATVRCGTRNSSLHLIALLIQLSKCIIVPF
jgi:hypothetical protein